jgi:hypothetical protein
MKEEFHRKVNTYQWEIFEIEHISIGSNSWKYQHVSDAFPETTTDWKDFLKTAANTERFPGNNIVHQ